MGKWGNEKINRLVNGVNVNNTTNQLCQSFKLWQSVCRKKWHIGGFGRYRRDSEEGWERFWWKKGIRRVGLAYRELIGSLYESWTIGIERVCKKLIHNMIRRYKKWQKRGFEAKERESSPRPSPKERGSVVMGKRINKLENLEISKFVGGV